MTFQPRLNLPRNTASVFQSTDDFFAAVLGRPQHDAHVQARREHQWLKVRTEAAEAGRRGFERHVADMIARIRADREARR